MEERVARVSLSILNSLSSTSLNNLFLPILWSLVSFLIHCYHCLFHTHPVVRKSKLKQLSRVYLQKIIAYNLSTGVRQSTRHWILGPGGGLQILLPLHMGIRITKENNAVKFGVEQCCTHVPQWEEACSLPLEDSCNSGIGQVPYAALTWSRDKIILTEPGKKKDIPTEGDKPSPIV